ncbi:kynurenine formamidase [Actinoplanes campanulatus]|uniref:Kynurenine formamidase n=1 Tax=Actinoplanes campanulatus TaxID=113559 RepID=A0A7W5ADM8_9ACTN|nr:cyclase family protein [Actinoplanes campanulatus]MBB3094221.1 kynurenine formamidase [Actinoplanes campanulatus]GGN43042.1 cyclase [Actinoplanes campanulatus]GID35859.1 cyclase [Actinoplanes campanulatus]
MNGDALLGGLRLVNLSHVNDPARVSVYPGDPPPRLETVSRLEPDGFYLQTVFAGEHTGTHWGAPGHFTPGGLLADELTPEDLFRPAVKIDVRRRCTADPGYAVTVADLEEWEQGHGRIPGDSFVVLWTGWEERFGTEAFLPHPGFAPEAVQWLTDTGRLGERGGTGTDAFSPDVSADTTFVVSRMVYRRRRISLEVLANLASLPTTGAWVLCGGQINKAGSGSPALIYGVLPPS